MSKVLTVLFLVFAMGLQASVNVLAISGSTREDSVNRKLLVEAATMAKQMNANVTIIDLRDYPMPFYDGDIETKEGMPQNAIKLQQLMNKAQVILIASPEYNRAPSAVLKNTIDWLSREKIHGLSGDAFKGKRFVLLSASPGGRGGAAGLSQLRTILEALGGSVMPEQFSLPNAYSSFDAQGNLKDQKVKAQLKALIQKALS
jgi:chromate reductase, NAD(P)H dehydrogenase (quinone)